MNPYCIFGGATEKFIEKEGNYEFFQSFTSGSDFALKAISVITAPVCFLYQTVIDLINTGIALVAYVIDVIEQNSYRHRDLNNVKRYLTDSASNLLLIPISSLVNLIDLIGSVVNSVKNLISPSTPEPTIKFSLQQQDEEDSEEELDSDNGYTNSLS